MVARLLRVTLYFNEAVAMEERPQTPSCFLSPETPGNRAIFTKETAPQEWSPSSTFLTPPSSRERLPFCNFLSEEINGLPKLDYAIEDDEGSKKSVETQRSLLLPADRIIGIQKNVDKVDFVFELLGRNCGQICHKVCDFLTGDELCRFASVSKAWRMFVTRESRIQERWKARLKECKEHFSLKGKENVGLPKGLSSASSPVRAPLSTLNRNKQEQRTESSHHPNIPAISSSAADLRPCPKCTSPSQTQPGQCLCQKCGLLFCSKCLRQMESHSSTECQGLPLFQTQTKRTLQSRKASGDIVGSKKSRDRIRRL